MKRTLVLCIACFSLVSALAWAQRTRVEVVRPTTPTEDSKPNSDAVPEGIAVSGQFA